MTILLPIDVEAPTLTAIPNAIQLGKALNTSIYAFHNTTGPPTLWMMEELHRLTRPIEEAGLTCHLRFKQGVAARNICQEAVLRNCSWIVMGAGIPPLGPVASAVFAAARVPVLAIDADGRLILRETGDADRLCEVLETRGAVDWVDGNVVLTLSHPAMEHAI